MHVHGGLQCARALRSLRVDVGIRSLNGQPRGHSAVLLRPLLLRASLLCEPLG